MSNSVSRPTIAVFTTGGTIGSRLDPVTGGISALATAGELLATAPSIDDVASIELHPWLSINSSDITPALMLDLAKDVSQTLVRPEIDGVVVTHGTDTVEETSLLADLVIANDKPVVFVAAMRNLGAVGEDGPRNLLDAIRVASHPAAHGRGALLVANDTIHATRYVTKTSTTNLATFESPDFGPLGIITGDTIRFLHPPTRGVTVTSMAIDSRVTLVKTFSGMTECELARMVGDEAQGIVLEGNGAGNIPSPTVPAVKNFIARGATVLLTSRAIHGFISPTYGNGRETGGGFDLVRLGVIPAQHLTSQKARIKLMVALGQPAGEIDLRAFFETP